ncbi:cell division cycle-associated protein 7 [Hippoglossus stenolepis]|uniref:cell division cycle-associated protein 7 n=1 Tax=Hippoglossus stenolepis TaxID=195615 RepID=UPI00159C8A01|nr:cell division cycle-associated protein 7 [Hippoglossus stenolepis]
MAGVLPAVFVEDSDSEGTFHGFSDTELKNLSIEDEAQLNLSPEKQKATSKPPAFRLRVALRSTPSTQKTTDDADADDDEEEAEEEEEKRGKKKRAGRTGPAWKKRRVKFEDEETAVAWPKTEEAGCDSGEEVLDVFLAKREQNIKANKAMLAQLMADLHKMPGVGGFLTKQVGKQKTKERSSRPPRSGAAAPESRRNPDRASRRQTRSMGGKEDSSAPKEEELELSLEEELLEVRRAPQRRGTPRPSQSKPHLIRPVDDITEDELLLVADNMTEKVYNSVSGSTCHQCRQKTIDTKTCCRNEGCRGIHGQFCGPCLRNRYGEDVRKALLDPEWKCPPCRGICNCSFCRQRDGRCPTGILFPLAQYHGFSNVHSYLSSLRSKLKSEDDDVET